MSDPNVYEVAHLKDADDMLITLGVDYDRVTISTGRWESGGGIKLTRGQAVQFAQWFAKAWATATASNAEEELESAVWSAMAIHKVTTLHPVEFVEAVSRAAMGYAAGDSDALTAMRRGVLHEASAPAQSSRSGAEGDGGPPRRRELDPAGLAGSPPEGATLSTGADIPYPGQGLFNLRPQPVDNDEWWAGAIGPDDE